MIQQIYLAQKDIDAYYTSRSSQYEGASNSSQSNQQIFPDRGMYIDWSKKQVDIILANSYYLNA